jgi:hypothetical protein
MGAIAQTLGELKISPVLLILWVIYFWLFIRATLWHQSKIAAQWLTMYFALLAFTLMPKQVEPILNTTLFQGHHLALYFESGVMFAGTAAYLYQLRWDKRVSHWMYVWIVTGFLVILMLAYPDTNRSTIRLIRNTVLLLPILLVFIPHHYTLIATVKARWERLRHVSLFLFFVLLAALLGDTYFAFMIDTVGVYNTLTNMLLSLRRFFLFLATTTALTILAFNLMSGKVLVPLVFLADRWRYQKLSRLVLYVHQRTRPKRTLPEWNGDIPERLYDMVLYIMDAVKHGTHDDDVLQQVTAAIHKNPDYEDLLDALIRIRL